MKISRRPGKCPARIKAIIVKGEGDWKRKEGKGRWEECLNNAVDGG